MAVGHSSGSFPVPATALAERWNAGSWVITPTPDPAGTTSDAFNAVSCGARDSCVAVGFKQNASSAVRGLVETWNGHRWQVVSSPTPLHASFVELLGVSCTAPDACIAVGGFIIGNRQEQPLAESWDGTTWTVQPTPNPPAENGSVATGVSCAGPSACTAVAEFVFGDVIQEIFAMQWDGIAWIHVRQPNPHGQIINSEASVSCSSASACAAVGSWTNNGVLPLIERWNGSMWTREAAPQPLGSAESSLSGVSCPDAMSCTAVGDSSTNFNAIPSVTLAERWNGVRWMVVATPNPTGALLSSLAGVACWTPGRCIAVGSSFKTGGMTQTLAEEFSG